MHLPLYLCLTYGFEFLDQLVVSSPSLPGRDVTVRSSVISWWYRVPPSSDSLLGRDVTARSSGISCHTRSSVISWHRASFTMLVGRGALEEGIRSLVA
jgi:hypothetical protein